MPASLAVATLIVCTFWGIASGLVGAVVVLMGVIAFNPMLRAGYDVKLASGVITAGGTLGILIPPSVMIIVYAAVAGQSVVKLYAAAMFPGFFLALPLSRLCRRLGNDQSEDRAAVTGGADASAGAGLDAEVQAAYSRNMLVGALSALVLAVQSHGDRGRTATPHLLDALQEFRHRAGARSCSIAPARCALSWWYVVIHQQAAAQAKPRGVEQLGTPARQHRPARLPKLGRRQRFYVWFGIIAVVSPLLMQSRYYRGMDAERLRDHEASVDVDHAAGILTVVVLGVILFGITTATESAGVGAAGAFLLAFQARTLDWKRTKEAVFLTAKTTAMVCWLFVGSALFSGRVRDPGGQALVEQWVLSLEPVAGPVHDPVAGDHLRSRLATGMDRDHHHLRADLPAAVQAFQHRSGPVGHAGLREPAGGVPVAPVAMSAYYLKGVSPPHVTINQIFAGMMPYMLIVIVCMIIMYLWPGMTLWLPNYLYGN